MRELVTVTHTVRGSIEGRDSAFLWPGFNDEVPLTSNVLLEFPNGTRMPATACYAALLASSRHSPAFRHTCAIVGVSHTEIPTGTRVLIADEPNSM